MNLIQNDQILPQSLPQQSTVIKSMEKKKKWGTFSVGKKQTGKQYIYRKLLIIVMKISLKNGLLFLQN